MTMHLKKKSLNGLYWVLKIIGDDVKWCIFHTAGIII